MSLYGINAHAPSAEDLGRLSELGAPWVRLDFNTYDLQPTREGYDYTYWDGTIRALCDRGFIPYATLSYTPAWMNGGRDRGAPPVSPEDWYNHVANVATHYQGMIEHWSLWNEPNNAMSVAQYVNLILEPGSQALRAVDPANLVCGPDLETVGRWERWLSSMLERGARHLDYLSVHCYQDNGHAVIDAVEQIDSHGLPVLLTETGWNSDRIGEAAQADHLQQLLESFTASSLLQLFVYDLSSTGWGISGKPSFDVYQRGIR